MDILDPRLFNLLPEHQTAQANNLWNCALFLTQLANSEQQMSSLGGPNAGTSSAAGLLPSNSSNHSYSAPQLHRLAATSSNPPLPPQPPASNDTLHQSASVVHVLPPAIPHHLSYHHQHHHHDNSSSSSSTEHHHHHHNLLFFEKDNETLTLSANLDEILTRLLKLKRRNKVN